MRRFLLVLFLLVFSTSTAANATTIYDNGGPNTGNGYTILLTGWTGTREVTPACVCFPTSSGVERHRAAPSTAPGCMRLGDSGPPGLAHRACWSLVRVPHPRPP